MSSSILERRLVDISERLKRLRADLAVTQEQYAFMEEEADDARLRALVAETPLGEVEARDARRHADALGRQRDSLARTIGELEREQDVLLDRLAAARSGR
jgi:chromosome segregation ATPase